MRRVRIKGGLGSGHFGHVGRVGEVGGSLPAGAVAFSTPFGAIRPVMGEEHGEVWNKGRIDKVIRQLSAEYGDWIPEQIGDATRYPKGASAWMMPNGKVVPIDDHWHAVEFLGIEKEGAIPTLLANGFVRINYSVVQTVHDYPNKRARLLLELDKRALTPTLKDALTNLYWGGTITPSGRVPIDVIGDVFDESGRARGADSIEQLNDLLGFQVNKELKGGPGSGHRRHRGRPHEVGGSLPSGMENIYPAAGHGFMTNEEIGRNQLFWEVYYAVEDHSMTLDEAVRAWREQGMTDEEIAENTPLSIERIEQVKGGAGSGHRGHRGRPGEIGGSQPGEGSPLENIPEEAQGGSCFDCAGHLLMDTPEIQDDAKLVHATVAGQGRLTGIRFVHAWVEVGDTVLDNSTGSLKVIPKELYYGLGNVRDVHRYTYREMIDKIIETENWGPWVDFLNEGPWEEKGGVGSGYHGHVGRAGEVGGSAPIGTPTPVRTIRVRPRGINSIAAESIKAHKVIEKKVTPTLESLANDQGGQLTGLENKFKSLESLSRKIMQEAKEGGLTLEEAAQEISDVLRYTITFDNPSDFVNKVKAVQKGLADNGYERYDNKWKNYFGPGDAYDGYNTVLLDPSTGLRFELQFHTAGSIRIKSVVHELYAEWRVLPQGDPRRDSLTAKMAKMWESYERPLNWHELEGVRMDLEQ